LTSEQLEAARAERMRHNGLGALTIEDARTWMEETGLCLFLPKKQSSPALAPSFVEAVAGERNQTPNQKQIATAEELLVRLELEGVAVRLNLQGQPGEQPDYVVAAWVLPYVYALRGDRDWRRTPQLTGSRQVSPLAIQAYKRLEANGDATIADLKQALGNGVSEMAVLRAITELWQQLRIIPVITAPGKAAKWQLLRIRFQKAIAEGASTSQVTAISVLASIFLQAVIAASMEEVELFLAPLTARSKIREVLRGLVATRQVHTLSMGHAPHFYVAGTLPEFSVATSIYASATFAGSNNFGYRNGSYVGREEEFFEAHHATDAAPARHHDRHQDRHQDRHHDRQEETAHANGSHNGAAHTNGHKPASGAKSGGQHNAGRARFSRPATHNRDRKPASASNGNRRPADARAVKNGKPAAKARPTGNSRTTTGAKPTSAARKGGLNRNSSSRKPALATSGSFRSRHNSSGPNSGHGSKKPR
jgi:hypothetical protein